MRRLIWTGQVQGLIHDTPSCRDLVERIVAEAQAIIERRLRDRVVTAPAPEQAA